jgi:hypothetical protein
MGPRERLKGSKIVHKSSKKFQRAITITHNGDQKQCSNVVSDKEDARQATKIGRNGRQIRQPVRFLE